MQINLSPYLQLPGLPTTLLASKLGDALTINGETFDFTQLPEGATLPAEAIGSDHFTGPVDRTNGELHLTLRLPHGPNPIPAVAFPQPITVTQDGPVELPT
jgi:hypothetical protein